MILNNSYKVPTIFGGAFTVWIAIILLLQKVQAGRIACTETSTCTAAYNTQGLPGLSSSCMSDEYCSNPYDQGCLRAHLGPENFPTKRICNSDDPEDAAERGLCEVSSFEYDEIRIENQDWDSPMLSAWIMQIMLSELLQVPTSIETNDPNLKYNFYDPQSSADYSAATYPYDNLRLAREFDGDCIKAKKEYEISGGEYRGCSHVMPMVNKVGQADNIQKLRDDDIVGQKDAGSADEYLWWIPQKLAKLNPKLQSYYSLSNDRQLLASTFLRPTTWGVYCTKISPNNCTINDEIAVRSPDDEDEALKYFVDGLYTGHFAATEKNDCGANPDTCTGHMANVPCSWGNYATPQAFHLNISVESDGNLEPNGAYGYSSLLDIYSAANATGSNVLMYWWQPDSLIESYRGSDYEMVPIYLPPPTNECVKNRPTSEQRCSASKSEQVGSPEGACDAGPVPLVILTALDTPDEFGSPAHAALQNYQLTNLDLQQLFQYRIADVNNDGRASVCRWFVENLDYIKDTFIPNTYPRQRRSEYFYQPFVWFTIVLGAISSVCVILCAVGSKYYEKTKVMIYAQVDFLLLILSGLFLVAVAAILHGIAPTKAVCISRQWLSLVGYSLELIPLALKVAAINKLFRRSKKMKKVTVSKKTLYLQVVAGVFLVCFYLTAWTIVDPPVPQITSLLREDSEDGYIVEISSVCASSNSGWKIASFVYLLVLLIIAAAIATQNRDIRQEFNESRYMVLLLYSHGMFSVLTLFVFLFRDKVDKAYTVSASLSLLLSLDTLITLGIYFVPKLTAATKAARLAANTARNNNIAPNEVFDRRSSLESSTDNTSFNWRIGRRRSLVPEESSGDDNSEAYENQTEKESDGINKENYTEQGVNSSQAPPQRGVFLEEELSEAPEATPAASDEFVWHIGAQSISSLNTSDHRHSWHSDHSKNSNTTDRPKQRESMPPAVSAWNAVASDKPKHQQRRVSWIDDSENVKGSAADDSQTKCRN